MTWGRLINGVKYIHLMNDNELKKKSLYDNVYFTLRDIFANAESSNTFMETNYFNGRLTNNVSFEDRTERFRYSNELNEISYVSRLHVWLNYFDIHYFKFVEPEEGEEIDMKKYMKWDDWWIQFEELKKLVHKQYKKCCRWEEEDVERDCDRLSELVHEDEWLDNVVRELEEKNLLDRHKFYNTK
jgi:hypothetical protein